jgi:hypothetical protein
MLENIARQMTNSPYFGMIPRISNMRGVIELIALLGETRYSADPLSMSDSNRSLIAGLRGMLKVIQFVPCLGSLPYFSTYWKYVPAFIAGSFVILHASVASEKDSNPIYDYASSVLNIGAKVVNSFAIGQLVHRTFYGDKPQGALMLAATAITLGISANNILYDWKHLGTFRRSL